MYAEPGRVRAGWAPLLSVMLLSLSSLLVTCNPWQVKSPARVEKWEK